MYVCMYVCTYVVLSPKLLPEHFYSKPKSAFRPFLIGAVWIWIE
jgi:hypothetical protein